MKKSDDSTNGNKRALVGGALLMAACAALPVVVRKLDHGRDEGARSLESIDLDLEHLVAPAVEDPPAVAGPDRG